MVRRIIGTILLSAAIAAGVAGDYLSTCAEDSCVVWFCDVMGDGGC